MYNYAEKFNLKNKLAFVLGGFGLIGKETTIALAEHGAKIIILDVKKNQSFLNHAIKKKFDIEFVKFDLKKSQNLEKSYSKILKIYNCPHIFINCSYPKTKDWKQNTFKKIKFNSFRQNIEYQLISSSWITFMTAELMRKRKIPGSIIQISSIYGIIAQDINLYKKSKIHENFTYPVIKGGLNNFGRQLAAFYGQYKIRINTIAPGGILSNQDISFIKKYSERTPLKRMGYAHEIASTAIFLSTDSSSYISGETIVVDGGFSKV